MSCVVLLIGTTTCNKVSADPAGEELQRKGGFFKNRGQWILAARTFGRESKEWLQYISKIQRDATVCRYLLTAKSLSTCFGRPSHPSSGEHKTETAASGTGHSI